MATSSMSHSKSDFCVRRPNFMSTIKTFPCPNYFLTYCNCFLIIGSLYILAFPCKRHHFYPFCHQKQVVELGEWLCMDVLKKVSHRHFVFRIPKILCKQLLCQKYEPLKKLIISDTPHFDSKPKFTDKVSSSAAKVFHKHLLLFRY